MGELHVRIGKKTTNVTDKGFSYVIAGDWFNHVQRISGLSWEVDKWVNDAIAFDIETTYLENK
ncbi:hypothetical protein ASG89_17315 [Paenibacillus sp. Soil766]|uniref:hypothetical protein n=1 Tax=Paenibacillus sp. Soil766 TaxID=1736404 RepID=UPI00070A78A5|nr:hypothetical protein [Paenibacillus sp. Soil766]KRF07113.1 hypothetical protein ASG89_17315 [Paenibacillus sp. Soil766]